ncbi:MAG: glycerol-3-phosphate dehydrogenase/oxidase [Thermodesulfobacteriota bacterium]|jgi:glycerol-3-phosphate dehydrogenase
MWRKDWRDHIWSAIDQPWDLIIIGGGITGAGVLRQAVAARLKTLLVEANDFASGTSSRSSKLIHGGFRYLRNKQINVTKESVREREWMLREAPNLVTPLRFLLPNFERYHFPSWKLGLGVMIYDLLAPKWNHCKCSPARLLEACPFLNAEGLIGGFQYYDAVMDDARLLLRILREAVQSGGAALSYTRAERLLRTGDGQVCGALLKDGLSPDGRTAEAKAKVVVNASGAWSDEVRNQLGQPARLRRLRGSHLVFSRARLPVNQALTLFHPRDGRAMFVIPWEGATIVGTTDIDHDPALDRKYLEPFASEGEIGYMMEALLLLFPNLGLSDKDIVSSFSGLRPVIHTGAASPSKESRAHALWEEDGLITITGGKYTTFRVMSRQTMDRVLARLDKPQTVTRERIFDPLPDLSSFSLEPSRLAYLAGRHGNETAGLLTAAKQGELEPIEQLPNVWAELRWAAREEGVEHLDDLLLRRVRLGLVLPRGARDVLGRIRSIVQHELGWSDERWQREEAAYLQTWQTYYSPKPG